MKYITEKEYNLLKGKNEIYHRGMTEVADREKNNIFVVVPAIGNASAS